jgi:ribose transport system ATP-binding protein
MADLIRSMVGRDIRQRPARTVKPADDIALEVRDLELGADRQPISLKLHSREVLGLAGLVGSGRSRLANALGGIRPAKAGTILRNGTPVQLKSPRAAVRAGIASIPEDRKREGLILEHSVRENIGLASLEEVSAAGFVRASEEKRLSSKAVRAFGIRPPDTERAAWTLSGGNQQKVVLGKWLIRSPAPEVVILDEPTRGVDVGAKYEIYQLIDELVERGSAVLLISSELPEVIAMSDRVLVMSAGQIVGELKAGELSEERILHLAVLGRQAESDPGDGVAEGHIQA